MGNYELSAIATDSFGIATTSAAVAVTAIANVPPSVSLTGPANGTTMKVPGSFTLTADAASTTSAIAKVDFYAIDNATNASTLIGTAIQAPYTANWSNVPLGDYTLSAVATDTLGAVTTSSQMNVTVNTGIAQAYYIHTDHLDTPRIITDTSGNIVWQWDNTDPFGANMANENPNGAGLFSFNLRFPGQYFDRETNLNYNVNRDYDPATGRYVQSDPIGLKGGINTYSYVRGNPVSFIDPFGLATTIVINNNTPIIGSHAGGFIGNQVYDPGGHYLQDRVAQYGENFKPTLADYIKYQKEDGSDVQIYTFPTSKKDEADILNRIDSSPTESGGTCATSVRDNLSGIGPFKDLSKTGFFPSTPSGLGGDLKKLLEK